MARTTEKASNIFFGSHTPTPHARLATQTGHDEGPPAGKQQRRIPIGRPRGAVQTSKGTAQPKSAEPQARARTRQRQPAPTPRAGSAHEAWVGIRLIRKFRVGFFGFLKFRVSKIITRNLSEIIKTRHFRYPKIRVRVNPDYPTSNRSKARRFSK